MTSFLDFVPEAARPAPKPLPTEHPKYSRDEALALIARVRLEVKRREWAADPELWAKERLGDTLWSGQVRILKSVRDNRKTAATTCHEVGKSFSAAVVAGWWLDIHKPGDAFVITTAPTTPQVRAILWKEMGRVRQRGNLNGRCNQTTWTMNVNGKDELVAMGRKPDEYDTSAFQGIHAPRVLFIGDEACGLPASLLEAADSMIANDHSKGLLIGNPDDPEAEFYQCCKPGSGYNVVQIGAFDTPNFTGEEIPKKLAESLIGRIYVEEKRRKWAKRWTWVDAKGNPATPETGVSCVPPTDAKREDTAGPVWFAKVLGEFPLQGEAGGLIPVAWIRAAQERRLLAEGDNELGVDVGGGGDSSTIAHRRGPVVRVIHEDKNPDTMETCGNVIAKRRETGATKIKVDIIGIGRGVVNRGQELAEPFYGINVGESPRDTESFQNLRAELAWNLRERFEAGTIDIDPDDDELADELASVRYKRLSSGKIQIESKDEAKRRGVKSPNRFDSVMLSFAPPDREAGDYGITV